jgi:hypothetical protein
MGKKKREISPRTNEQRQQTQQEGKNKHCGRPNKKQFENSPPATKSPLQATTKSPAPLLLYASTKK